MPLRCASTNRLCRVIMGKRPVIHFCAIAVACFVSTKALAMDEEISFCGDRFQIPGFPAMGVFVQKSVSGQANDLEAMISLAEDGSPPRATIYYVRAGDAILL